jgi:hypothetical protein
MSGRADMLVKVLCRFARRFELEPWIVTQAQFMYISRFPTSLNHVHAKRAFPEGAKDGIVKGYVVVIGQPPIMLLMTLKVAPLS